MGSSRLRMAQTWCRSHQGCIQSFPDAGGKTFSGIESGQGVKICEAEVIFTFVSSLHAFGAGIVGSFRVMNRRQRGCVQEIVFTDWATLGNVPVTEGLSIE